MINKIFWDADETLIHTLFNEKTVQPHITFQLKNDGATYNTIVRGCAQSVIDFSREIVGADNVYILTTATQDYANTINKLAGWNFREDQIISRDDIAMYKYSTAYGGSAIIPSKLAHKNNILIDNLPWRYNTEKMKMIGIQEHRYMKIQDYYGVECEDDSFEQDVKEFIIAAHKEAIINHEQIY